MKYFIFASFLCVLALSCSPKEEQQAAQDHPGLKATTQAAENLQQKIDPVVDKAKVTVDVAKGVADGAAAIGIPYAGTLAVILGIAGTVLGKYHERRTGTTPLSTAVTQIVQSVEQAFPAKTPEQKAALATIQDQSTKVLVSKIKGA
jgi:hypothetical protein